MEENQLSPSVIVEREIGTFAHMDVRGTAAGLRSHLLASMDTRKTKMAPIVNDNMFAPHVTPHILQTNRATCFLVQSYSVATKNE